MGLEVIALNIALVGIGVALWLRREVREGLFVPGGPVPSEVYRTLERGRARLFRGSRAVRLTLFREEGDDVLRPVARLGWGRPTVESTVRFRTGEGLAGEAWKHPPGTMLLAQMGPFQDLDSARLAQQRMFGIDRETASALSERQLQASALVAITLGIGDRRLGVLCIDSLDAELVPRPKKLNAEAAAFWSALSHMGARLSAVLESGQRLQIQHTKELKRDNASRLSEVMVA